MSSFIRTIIISMISITILVSMTSCASGVSQEEYDSVMSELNDARSQLTVLQDRLTEAATDGGQDLSAKYDELQNQYDSSNDELQAIKSDFNELNSKFEQIKGQYDAQVNETQSIQNAYDEINNEFLELQRQYDVIIQGTVNLNEEEINQAIFNLINEERINNGLNELIWGTNLYKLAIRNSREMAEKGEYQYSTAGAVWQQVYMAARYATLDQIANAALITWKGNDYRYEYTIINPTAVYGAVATHKEGEVYYISYLSSIYK